MLVAGAALFAQNVSLPIIGISRHALTNNGRIESSAQQFLGESNNINSSANFFGDFFVPGTPNVNVNGSPVWNGVQVGSGSINPSGYSINVNAGAHLDHLMTRTDAGTLAAIAAPPNPSGSRNINIDNPSQAANAGDWSTVRDVNLNSNAGNVTVPPGTYGNFTASNSDGSGFVFGVAGSSQPAVYNLQQLTLNSNSRLTLVGPVIITVRNQVSVNSNTAILGAPDNQNWLQLYSSNGGFSVNSGSIIYGEVKAPSGHIDLNGTIVGTAAADYLSVNSSGVLKPGVTNHAPSAADDSYSVDEDATLTVPAPGVLDNDADSDGDTLTAVKVTNPSHGDLTFNANGSFTYVPAANYHGADSFTYKNSDGTLFSDVVTVSITVNPVNDAPVAADGTLATDEDAPKAGQLHATDIDGDALTYSIVTPPGHGTVQLGANGAYTYTPNADYNGADSFVFKANDGTADSNHATISITVNPLNDAPVAADDSYTTPKNTALTLAAPGVLGNDSDVDGDALTAAVETQPAHGTLALNADGGLTYTPQAGYVGDDSFTYRASDGTLQSNIATVTLSVTFVNTPPTAQDGSVTTDEDTAAAVTLQGNDADSDTLTYTIVTPPQHGTLSGTAPDLTYTPAAHYSGADNFTFKTNDGSADSNIATIAITINPVNHAPVAQESTFTIAEDTALQGQVAATDADGDALTYQLVTDTGHGTLALNGDGSFTYTPEANYNGADSFVFKANDGAADSNPATVHITVTPVNDAPAAQDDAYATPEDVPLTIPAPGVLGNDNDVDGGALTAVVATQPAHGTLTLNSDGSFTYIPNADYNGSDSFTYHASDGTAQSNLATVTLTVSPINDAPHAQDGAWTTDEDTPLQGQVAATDADGDTLTFAAATQPQHGTLALNADGSFTYTPQANYNGTDSFVFTANDGTVDSNPATVTITVNPVNDAPVAADDQYTTARNTALTVDAPGVLGNDNDIDGDTLHAVLADAPTHGTLELHADGSFTYTPSAQYTGEDSFTYRAGDRATEPGLSSNLATVHITITNANTPPTAQNGSVTTDEDTAVAVTLQGNDADGDTLTYTIVTPPQHGTLSGAAPNLTYTPAADYNGADSFTFTTNDGQADSAAATISITVNPVNDAPVAVNDSAATRFGEAVSVDVLANDSDADVDALSVSAVTPGEQGGATSIGGDGKVLFTPAPGFEGTDTFSYTVSDGQGGTAQAFVTVTVGARPALSIGDVQVAEGNAGQETTATLQVSLSSAAALPVTVQWATADGSAQVSEEDYAAASGTVTFAPGETSKPVTVTIHGDNFFEPDETFSVSLSSPSNAAIASATATVTILNDDAPPQEGACGPIDVAFVIDDTGSMGGALDNIKQQLDNILEDIEETSDNDYRLSLVTFKDDVTVRVPFAPNNREAFAPQILGLYADGGGNGPEASDEALNTVVNALPAAGRPQTGDATPFRANALKLVILVTDALPAGFDDDFTAGVDDFHDQSVAVQAARQHIKIATIQANTDLDSDYEAQYGVKVSTVLKGLSNMTGSRYIPTDAAGQGAEAAVRDIVRTCGGFEVPQYCGDTQAPTITITSPADGSRVADLSPITGTLQDAGCSSPYAVHLKIHRLSDDTYWHLGSLFDPPGWYNGESWVGATLNEDGTWKLENSDLLAGYDLPEGDYEITAVGYDSELNASDPVTVHVTVGLANDAAFVSQNVPAQMTAGQQYTVSVTMKNTGLRPWTLSGNYNLGSQNPQDNERWGMHRVPLDASDTVAPGAEHTFTFTVTAPTVNGVYNFQWQMVQDGVAWFGEMTPNVPITVTGGIESVVDLLARNAADSDYVGDNIYNSTGDNQVKTQSVTASQTATYLVKIQNDGPTTASIPVSADGWNGLDPVPDAPTPDWQVKVLSPDNTDITYELFGDFIPEGYQTPPLDPGGEYVLKVEVTPTRNAPVDAPNVLHFTGGGYGEWTSQSDTVRLETTRITCGDTEPPTVAIATPADGATVDNLTSITGTAADSGCAGLDDVEVAIKRVSDGAWWQSGGFYGGDEFWNKATLDENGNWTYADGGLQGGALPAGDYDIIVRSWDTDGNQSAEVTRRVTVYHARPRPDVLARTEDGGYVGSGIYNTNGENQTVTGRALDSTAVYYVKVQNTGDAAGDFYLYGSGWVDWDPQGWDVKVFDSAGNDITFELFEFMDVPYTLQPGESVELRVEVTPDSTVALGTQLALGFDAYSSDTWGYTQDVAGAVTTKEEPPPAPAQPDGQIGTDGTTFQGDNVYNASGTDQTATLQIDAGATATYHLKLQNDSASPDNLILISGDTTAWNINYFDSDNNDISAAVKSTSGWTTPELASGASADVRVEVSAADGTPPGSTLNLLMAVYSQRDTSLLDMLKAVTSITIPPPATWQSDALIRNATDSSDAGDNIYNITGENQTAQQTASTGTPAQYLITAQNDGNTAQQLVIHGATAAAPWTVHYFDADNNDITSSMTDGWQTPLLNPGEKAVIRLEVAPDSSLLGESTLTLGVEVDSTQDGSRDVVLAVTHKEAEPPQAAARPDAQINGIGDNVYNATGADQTATLEINGGATATFTVKLQNDSTDPDHLLLGANTTSGWNIKYFTGTTDITAAVNGTGWVTDELAAGASAEVRVEVTPDASTPPGSSLNIPISIYSQRDSSLLDMVRAVTSIKVPPPPSWKVDALIRNATDGTDVGGDIYNITGDNQTVQQTAFEGAPAEYLVTAQNDGDAPQKLLISAPANAGSWTIHYYDGDNNDITSSIASGGWQTETLDAGAQAVIRVQVEPAGTLPAESTFKLGVEVDSTQDGSRDVVIAWTGVSGFPPPPPPEQATDMLVNNTGDNVYNTTGENQTATQQVQAGETASYDITLQNDGEEANSYKLKMPAPAAGWTVKVTDISGGNTDITNAVESTSGWLSPSLVAGGQRALHVEFTPDTSVADNAVQESLLTASTESGDQPDAVKMQTTRLPGSTQQPTGTLPAPVITPAEGTYTGMVKVNITPGEDSPSATIIYYSLDGSTPGPGNPASRPSSGTILLVQDATVTAIAYATGFTPSPAASATYQITRDPAVAAPGVAITSPGNGAEITAPTAIKGTVQSTDLAYWELAVRPVADNQSTDGPWQRIAWGETTEADAPLGTLDPTLLLNGLYEVRLAAYDRAGQSVEDSINVVIKGGMKIGNFSLSFTDMVLPVAGMPLAVTRTYDSRDKRAGDFGVGWSLGISDVRIQKNGPVGGTDQMPVWNSHRVIGAGLFPVYVIDPVKPRIVTITLPDGTVYSFRAKVEPEQQQFGPITYGNIAWVAQPGTKGTLQIVGDSSFEADTQGLITLNDDFGNPVDYQEFILTLPDGRSFYVEEGVGIHWMRDRNGNEIDFLRDSSGKVMELASTPAGSGSPARAVFFTRGTDGRITSISDAKGAKVLYQQDANGDLVKVTDRANNVTHFLYDPLHNIVDIQDPRGVQAVRNEYDYDGRLIATIDAEGHRIEFDHNIDGRTETVLDRKGRQSVMHYDDYGNVTSTTRFLDGRAITTSSEYADPNNPDKPTKTTDALGNSTSFVYDANGSPTQITDPLNHTTQMTYDGTQVKTVTDAAGVVVVDNSYNAQGQLLSSKDALGNVTQYTYFPCGAPQRVTDAKGNFTTYAFDASYNIASVTDAKGHQVVFDYDANGSKIKQTTNRTAADGSLQSLITSYVYDGNGHITQTVHPDGSISYTTYNSIGKVDYTRDALNRITSFDYDELGQKIGTTYPDGTTSATSYDANGNVLTNTDRAGRTTTYQYDDLDRQVKTIMPDGTYTQQVYDDDGRVTESYDENHHKTSYEYDAAGRQTKTTDALGDATITSYDSRDRQTSVEDALHKTTSFSYDDDGRLLSTTYDDGTSTSSAYDELGRVIQQTDQKGRVTKFAFDELGRLVGVDQVMDPDDSSKDLITTYAYDEVGNKILQTDANANRTSFAYDNMGRLTGRKLPGGQIEAMAYNSVGQLTAKTDFAGDTTHFAYDQRGRLIQKVPDAALGEATVSFSYPNELTKISTRGSIQNIYKYDPARGWLNSVQTRNGTINYGYDAVGNRTTVRITGKDGGNRETDYTYDELNRVSSVSRTGMGTLASYNYDAIGNVSQVTRANGVTSTYGYDDLHRLTSIQHKQGATILSQFNYALSADGKRNTLQEYLKYPAGQTVASVNRTVFYGYDAAGRLNAEQRQSTSTLTAGGTIANTARTMWTYDKVGNRLTQAVSNYDGIGVDSPSVLKSTFNTSYNYNINDWLTSTTAVKNDDTGESTFTTNFEYNANGSQTAVTTNVGTPDEKRTPYFYDFEQKLTGIGNPTDTIKHSYAYDADGNRIAESNTSASGTDVRNYLVDPNNSNAQIVEEYNSGSTLLAHYDWNDAELLREASLDENTSTYVIHQPLADAQNSTRQLLDGSGAVSDVYGFDAWGNQQENIGGSFNPYRYNTQRLDASGLYYLRARQYSSGIGRFLTHDPYLGSENTPITLHRYMYAGDDPVDNYDPNGRMFSLSGALTSIGISSSIASTASVSLDVASYIVAAGSAYNIYSDYTSGGTVGIIDVLNIGLASFGISSQFDTVGNGLKSLGALIRPNFANEAEVLDEVIKVAKSPKLIARAKMLGFSDDVIRDLPERLSQYRFGEVPFGGYADETMFLIRKQSLLLRNREGVILHELGHVLDDIADPGLFARSGSPGFTFTDFFAAESKAYYMQYGKNISPLVALNAAAQRYPLASRSIVAGALIYQAYRYYELWAN